VRNRPASVRRAGRPPALRRSSFCRLGGISRKTPEKLSRSGGLGPPQTSGGPLSRDRSCFPIRTQRPAAATQRTRCSAPLPFPAPHAAAPGLRRSAFAPPHPNPYPPYTVFYVIGRGSGEGSWGSGRAPFYSPACAPARCVAAAPTATSSVVVFHPWPQSQLLGPFRARSLRRRPEALAVHRNYLVPTRF